MLRKSDLGCGSQRDESTEPVTTEPRHLSFPISARSGAEGTLKALLSHLGWAEELNQDPPAPAQDISPGRLSHPPRANTGICLPHTHDGVQL